MYSTRTTCRSCGTASFDPLLDLGHLCLSTFLKPEEPDPAKAPFDLVVCSKCDLVQLRHTVDPKILYGATYWYRSEINEAMVVELQSIVRHAQERLGRAAHTVLDVGANDGTLLRQYDGTHTTRIAVEPAASMIPRLHGAADIVLHDFFPSAKTKDLRGRSIDIISSIAMFYDIDDPKDFVAEVDRLLSPDGVWIVQMQDLEQMVAATAFDNICTEHLCYYSLRTFQQLLEPFNLYTVDAEQRTINGGSLRITVRRRAYADRLAPRVMELLHGEHAVLTRESLDRFAHRAGQFRDQILGTLQHFKHKGLVVDIYGGSTKGNTTCQYVGIDRSLVRQAIERSPEKWGRVLPGSRIPIVSEEIARADPADVWMCNIWGFRTSVLLREQDYLARGGCIFFPLPRPELVTCLPT